MWGTPNGWAPVFGTGSKEHARHIGSMTHWIEHTRLVGSTPTPYTILLMAHGQRDEPGAAPKGAGKLAHRDQALTLMWCGDSRQVERPDGRVEVPANTNVAVVVCGFMAETSSGWTPAYHAGSQEPRSQSRAHGPSCRAYTLRWFDSTLRRFQYPGDALGGRQHG